MNVTLKFAPTSSLLGIGLLAMVSVGSGTAVRPSISPASEFEPTRAGGTRVHDGLNTTSPCPPGSLSDEPLLRSEPSHSDRRAICVRLPDDDDAAPIAESVVNAHRDPRGRWVVYDQIPRRPDRPADYGAYRYPVPCEGDCVLSGYDLDRPDELQRRGKSLRQVGHGAIDLGAPRGAPVNLITLEHQQGPAELLFAGPLFGTTVITRHTLREAGQLRDYVVILGHLETVAAGLPLSAGQSDTSHGILAEGQPLGFVGDSGSPGIVHLHVEVRRVRAGIDVRRLFASGPGAVLENASTIVCDPRNVLPLR